MSAVRQSSSNSDILNGSIPATLKRMTVPMIFGMIMLMSFNLVDTFFISLLGTEPLAAVSFTFPVTFTIISLAIGLGIGTSAVIAKALGSKEIEEAKFDAFISLILAAVLVALLAALGYVFMDPIFMLLGADDTTLPYIHDYMNVWFLGAVFLITPMIGNSVLRASGDTKTPSMIMGLGGLINAVLDPILIFGWGPVPELGVQGAAIASVIAWAVGVVVIIYLLAIKKRLLSCSSAKQSSWEAVSKIMKIGLPAAGANMLTPIAMAVMTAIVATYGAQAVAAFGVGSRIESIACLVILALSMTLPPFVSQNYGAGNFSRVKEAYTKTLKFVLMWQFGIYLLLILTAHWVSQAFGNEPEVIGIIKLFIYILPLSYGLQGIIILTNSSFNALHKPMNALILSIVRLFVFYIPCAYIGSHIAGLTGLFVGAAIGNLFTAISAYIWFSKTLNGMQQEGIEVHS
ncbi:MATE family efflux transporter [Pseudoalteromonas luteoviolacea]|uniref:Multidrug transporter MatE n=1 Tax=Pseudoalteromonas luteoviolacea H33 TaxID=1365251 RepID=A0A161Y400_9GAMM|nr:MATE family efflux transporter [Pseudoalteromonas luteoviolacea]KZN49935.1 multidrug transporter MatE [Pseudoalteromonas luteoviolacea H33]KZN79047.1 multidrug transporter MatE [Pseudoalteromonas luteoviolacea H33-S]